MHSLKFSPVAVRSGELDFGGIDGSRKSVQGRLALKACAVFASNKKQRLKPERLPAYYSRADVDNAHAFAYYLF